MSVCLPTLLLVASGRGRHVPLFSVLPLLLLVSMSEQQSICSSGYVENEFNGVKKRLKIASGRNSQCLGGIVLIDESDNNKATFIHRRFIS